MRVPKEKWIERMQKAMQNREYSEIANLCNISGDLNCAEYCPFLNICDWIVGLTNKLPYEYLYREE